MERTSLPDTLIPRHATLLLTWACNSRCQSCKIWEIYKDDRQAIRKEMSLDDYARLIADPLFKQITNLGLAGGEPLMRPDLFEIIALIPQNVQLFIATNAITLGRIKQLLPILQARGNSVVQISIDGIGEMHDRVRGVPGNYERCLRVLDWLVEKRIPRVISSTLSTINYQELPALYALANKYGAGFAFRTANKGDFYDNVEDRLLYEWQPQQIEALREEIKPIVEDQLLRGETSDATGVFWNEIPNWLQDTLQMPGCLAAYKTFLVDPVGEVYPCPSWWHSLGRVKTASFTDVWQSSAANQIRAEVDVLKCGGCWNDCTWPQVLLHEPGYVNRRVAEIRRQIAAGATRAEVTSKPIKLMDRLLQGTAASRGNGRGPAEIHPGDAADAMYLAYGWHAIQNMPPLMRWTQQEAAVQLDLPADARRLGLHLMVLHPDARRQPVQLEVCVDESSLAPVRIDRPGWKTLWLDLPRSARGKSVQVTLRVDRPWVPFDEIGTSDSRELGVAIERIWAR